MANRIMHLTVAEAYVEAIYTGLCGAYARARALGPAPCLALRGIYCEFGEPRDLVRSRSRETWCAAGQASRQPLGSGAFRMKLVARTAERYRGPVIPQLRKVIQ